MGGEVNKQQFLRLLKKECVQGVCLAMEYCSALQIIICPVTACAYG